MASALALKIGALAVKTLAKPVTKRLKNEAASRPEIYKFVVEVGNWTNRLSAWITVTAAGHKSLGVARMDDPAAFARGADFLSETFIFALGGGLIIFEYNRSATKSAAVQAAKDERNAKFRRDLEERFTLLEKRVLELEADNDRWTLFKQKTSKPPPTGPSFIQPAPPSAPTPAIKDGSTKPAVTSSTASITDSKAAPSSIALKQPAGGVTTPTSPSPPPSTCAEGKAQSSSPSADAAGATSSPSPADAPPSSSPSSAGGWLAWAQPLLSLFTAGKTKEEEDTTAPQSPTSDSANEPSEPSLKAGPSAAAGDQGKKTVGITDRGSVAAAAATVVDVATKKGPAPSSSPKP